MRLPKQPYSKQDQNNDREFVITVFHPVLNRQQHREEKLFSFELEIKREENNKKKTQDPYKTNILILWGVHGYTQLCLKQANKKKTHHNRYSSVLAKAQFILSLLFKKI